MLLGIGAALMDTDGMRQAQEPSQNTPQQPIERSNTEGAATPSPAREQSYVEVFTFNGNGAKKSDTFVTEGDKFRIRYNCSGDLCQAWLKEPGGSLSLELIMNTTGSVNDESMFYGAGTYYIESNSLGKYSMTVEDYK